MESNRSPNVIQDVTDFEPILLAEWAAMISDVDCIVAGSLGSAVEGSFPWYDVSEGEFVDSVQAFDYGTDRTPGPRIGNTTPATSGDTKQNSPALMFEAHSWDANDGVDRMLEGALILKANTGNSPKPSLQYYWRSDYYDSGNWQLGFDIYGDDLMLINGLKISGAPTVGSADTLTLTNDFTETAAGAAETIRVMVGTTARVIQTYAVA